MVYDFTSEGAPKGTNSVKWDMKPEGLSGKAGGKELLPMWVAEMDFPAAPFIVEALHRRIDKRVFGYTLVPDSYYSTVIDWFSRRHGWNISREQIIPISGIVPATSVAIRALAFGAEASASYRHAQACSKNVAEASTPERSKVVMNVPAYNCFFSNIRNTGCELSASKLLWDEATHTYQVDWEDFERRCADPEAKVFLLCNPHNPTGRLWTREELSRMGEICLRYGLPVISDEIHCEIVAPAGSRECHGKNGGYTPFASISPEFAQNSISFVSPTKNFNIAGLQIANIISANEEFRARMDRVINDWEHCDVNQLGIVALQAAYTTEGEEWLTQMNDTVYGNFCLLRDALAAEFPQIRVPELQATYLLWLDFSDLPANTGIAAVSPLPADTAAGAADAAAGAVVSRHLLETEHLWINDGAMYGDPACCRLNLACPRATMQEAVKRLLHGLHTLTK